MILTSLKENFNKEGGYKQLILVAIPLIFVMGYLAIMEFIDRTFLAWYSKEALAAVTPASSVNFMITSIFNGIVMYVANFSAQYYGANEENKVGKIIWHGLYLCLLGGICLIILSLFSEHIFLLFGHEKEIQVLEVDYFKIISRFSVFSLIVSLLVNIYAMLNRYKVILFAIVGSLIGNIILDYIMIFGKLFVPEMGVRGSAAATIISTGFGALILLIYLKQSDISKKFKLKFNNKFQFKIFKELIKYGSVNGILMFLEAFGFNSFLLIIGRQGINELTASNIALNINNILFLPLFGLGTATSIVISEYVGKKNYTIIKSATINALKLGYIYAIPLCLILVLKPDFFISPFITSENVEIFAQVEVITKRIMLFVAAYTIFDTINVMISGLLKGVGDIKYIIFNIVTVNIIMLIILLCVVSGENERNIYYGWGIYALSVANMSVLYIYRYRSAKWQESSLMNF